MRGRWPLGAPNLRHKKFYELSLVEVLQNVGGRYFFYAPRGFSGTMSAHPGQDSPWFPPVGLPWECHTQPAIAQSEADRRAAPPGGPRGFASTVPAQVLTCGMLSVERIACG